MYVSGNGSLSERRPCGRWMIPALFWTIIDLFGLFFLTMTPCLHYNKKKDKIATLN